MRSARLAAWGIAAGLAIACAATLAIHEDARDAWARERALLGSEEYDAARSDAAWDEARWWRTLAERVALAGAAALVIASAARVPEPEPVPESEPGTVSEPPPARVLTSTLLDGTLLAAALLATRALSLESALGDALAWWLPALVLAAHTATLARGATVGMRAVGIRAGAAPWWRVLAAALATPLAPPIALVAWILGARRPAWLAPHLALAGLEVR